MEFIFNLKGSFKTYDNFELRNNIKINNISYSNQHI